MQTLTNGSERWGEWRAAIGLLLFYLLAVILVPPLGDFPLNDDWSYAAATKHLLDTGELKFQPWTSVSLVLQLLWGAAACWLAGFSFEVLRATTMIVSWLGSIGCYLLLRLWVREKKTALLCALVVAANPLYLSLSYTFMTDVPFTAVLVWAAFFYARGLRRQEAGDLVAGGVFSAAAVLIRPYGILAAGAAGLCALLLPLQLRQRLQRATAATAMPLAVFAGYHLWLALGPGLPAGYQARLAAVNPLTVPVAALDYGFRTVEYLGLFLLPLTLARGGWRKGGAFRPESVCLVLLGIAAAVVYLREGGLMFYLTNILYDLGAGALTLRDSLFLGLPAPWGIGLWVQVPLTLVATIGGALLMGSLGRALVGRGDPARQFLLVSAGFFLLFFFFLSRYYLDRHLLVLLPLVTAIIAGQREGLRLGVLAGGLILMGAFSLAATHDYLAWNSARWRGLEATMVEDGVGPEAIDGGFEFNGWFLAERLGTVPTDEEVKPPDPERRKSWWWVVDDRFVASFRPLAGYGTRRAERFRRLLPWGRGEVLILERKRK